MLFNTYYFVYIENRIQDGEYIKNIFITTEPILFIYYSMLIPLRMVVLYKKKMIWYL